MKDVNLFLAVTNMAVVVLCGALIAVIPTLTRKSFLFGVKIPMEQQNSQEAKSMKKRYTVVVCAGVAFLMALSVLQYIYLPDLSLVAVMYIPLLIIPVQLSAFVPNWKRALRLKEERRWRVPDTSFAETSSSHSRGNLSELPWIWYIVSLGLILVGVIIALVKYPSLPDTIPTHFDINMKPDGWSEKSIWVLLMMPLVDLFTLAICWLSGIAIVKAKLQIDPVRPALSFAQHRLYRKYMGHGLGFLTLVTIASIMLPGLKTIMPELDVPFWPIIVMVTVAVVPLLVIVVRSGQGGCKLKLKNPPPEPGDSDSRGMDARTATPGRGDDRNWVLGMFYYNPDDPAILIGDRFGTNLGFNYARLPVKIGVAAALALFVVGYAWLTVFLTSIQ